MKTNSTCEFLHFTPKHLCKKIFLFFKEGRIKVIFLFCGSRKPLLESSLLRFQNQERLIPGKTVKRVKFIVNNPYPGIPFQCFIPFYLQQFPLFNEHLSLSSVTLPLKLLTSQLIWNLLCQTSLSYVSFPTRCIRYSDKLINLKGLVCCVYLMSIVTGVSKEICSKSLLKQVSWQRRMREENFTWCYINQNTSWILKYLWDCYGLECKINVQCDH